MLWDLLALLFVTVALGAAFGAVPAHGWMLSRQRRDERPAPAIPPAAGPDRAAEPARVIAFPGVRAAG